MRRLTVRRLLNVLDEVGAGEPWCVPASPLNAHQDKAATPCYRAPASSAAPSAQLVKVAGARWKVEDGFAVGKDLAALDEHQVRSWTILGLLTHAFLSGLAAASQPDCSHPCDHLLIALTRNEIRRPSNGLGHQLAEPATQLNWSRWRRRYRDECEQLERNVGRRDETAFRSSVRHVIRERPPLSANLHNAHISAGVSTSGP